MTDLIFQKDQILKNVGQIGQIEDKHKITQDIQYYAKLTTKESNWYPGCSKEILDSEVVLQSYHKCLILCNTYASKSVEVEECRKPLYSTYASKSVEVEEQRKP